MTDQVELNCMGMKCPRPMIELAKVARKVPPGSVLDIQADDQAFESDVRAWTEYADATILKFDKQGDVVKVKLKLKG